jgi:hypothetical protein
MVLVLSVRELEDGERSVWPMISGRLFDRGGTDPQRVTRNSHHLFQAPFPGLTTGIQLRREQQTIAVLRCAADRAAACIWIHSSRSN